MALEIKSSEKIGGKTKGLHLFGEEQTCKKDFIISKEQRARKLDSELTILPWREFCERLWDGEVI